MVFGRETQANRRGQETATFRSADGSTTVALTRAVRYPMTKREMAASYGVYRADDVIWTLGVADLAGQTPAPRCRIESPSSGGGPFTILDAAYSPLALFWRCTTRNLALAADLAQTCSFERANWTVGAGGSRVATWSDVPGAVDLACRFQTDTGEPYELLAKRGERITGKLYLASWPDLTIEDRCILQTSGDPVTLQLRSWRNVDRIDALPELDVEQVPS